MCSAFSCIIFSKNLTRLMVIFIVLIESTNADLKFEPRVMYLEAHFSIHFDNKKVEPPDSNSNLQLASRAR